MPGYESVGWFGLLAPAHTPKEIVDKLNKAVVAIMASRTSWITWPSSAPSRSRRRRTSSRRYINADVAKWSALVKEQNITIPGAGK